MEYQWNLWHGCHKISEGCRHCYVYRQDSRVDRDASRVFKTRQFNLPVQKYRKGDYKVPSGSMIWTCFSSDFFLEDADEWRKEAWLMIRERKDLHFFFITKRIDRFYVNLPADWGDGYENVTICCTCENQDRADYRLPIYLKLPIRHKIIICEPCLGAIDLRPYLNDCIEQVIAGGESGSEARRCRFEWITDLQKQCKERDITFVFKQTGTFLEKNGRMYHIPRQLQHAQARKANINFIGKNHGYHFSGKIKKSI